MRTSSIPAQLGVCLLLGACTGPPEPHHGEAQAALSSASTPFVTPLAAGQVPDLDYWPFTPSDEAMPALTRINTDFILAQGGCGTLEWEMHPVPGSDAKGRFCVGLLDAGLRRYLVVGEPGLPAYVIAPASWRADTLTGELEHHRPAVLLPSMSQAMQRWAAAPGAAP